VREIYEAAAAIHSDDRDVWSDISILLIKLTQKITDSECSSRSGPMNRLLQIIRDAYRWRIASRIALFPGRVYRGRGKECVCFKSAMMASLFKRATR